MLLVKNNFKMRRANDKKWTIVYISVLIIFGLLFLIYDIDDSINPAEVKSQQSFKKDWHDYKAMYHEALRVGLGEQGKAATLNNRDSELEMQLSMQNGFNALLSDAISVNRSVPDVRYEGCDSKEYLSNLPQVSVVISFYNEHFSVLMRSVHSIINRTPPELLKEIILVDDNSFCEDLFEPLDDYIAKHFTKVRLLRMPERSGLIRARMAGMRNATAEVLVVFDSHIETNYNWLPPLIEPIALNKRTVVCPLIDGIKYSNFEYVGHHGYRGGFDWTFKYVGLDPFPQDLADRTKPYKNPIMAGGLFAISAEFFWEIGGYDEGLDIWGGEQYELSLKIWMCGGQMFNAPCSRVAHIYRGPMTPRPNPRKDKKYILINYKRVAEVWLDEHKKYIYERGEGIYENVDAGDLTAQKALREKLKCKSFKWFMEEVAFDFLRQFPPEQPPEYAYGAIQNVGAPSLCIDTLGGSVLYKVGVYPCATDLKNPQENQKFSLSMSHELHIRHKTICLDVFEYKQNASVWMWTCHRQGGNQYWHYDRFNKWILHEQNGSRCLEASPEIRKLYVNTCMKNNTYMQWNFGFVNTTALDKLN